MKQKRVFLAAALSILLLSCSIFPCLAEGTEPPAAVLPEDNGSQLAAFFKTMDPEKGIHIIAQYEVLGMVTTIESQSKGQNYYSTMSIEGLPSDGSFELYADNRLYKMNADKTGYYTEISDGEILAQQFASQLTGEEVDIPENVEIQPVVLDKIYSFINAHVRQSEYEKLEQEVDGVVLTAEKYAALSEYGDDQTFCFDEMGRLVYILNPASELFGTPAITFKILQIDEMVDESLFDTTGFETVDYQTYMASVLESLGNG